MKPKPTAKKKQNIQKCVDRAIQEINNKNSQGLMISEIVDGQKIPRLKMVRINGDVFRIVAIRPGITTRYWRERPIFTADISDNLHQEYLEQLVEEWTKPNVRDNL